MTKEKEAPYKTEQRRLKALAAPRILEQHWGKNRRQRRYRSVDRSMTKKGFGFGRAIGSFEDNIIHHIAKRQEEK